MKLKTKIAALTVLTAFQFANVEAAEIDNELAILAAEQDKSSGEFLTPEQNSPQIISSKENIPDETKKKIEDKSVSEPSKSETSSESQPASEPESVAQQEETIQPVGLPNPIVTYANFEDLAEAVNFTPLYIPKKSGYTISSFMAINNRIAEIRYGRRWEPEVSLHIRTYKRPEGESLRDISGVHGVKWRIDVTSGNSIYIAKINERSHVAAWASGDYTFSAYVENLSFAAFHSLVTDELVDLTTHYFKDQTKI